MFGSKKQTEAAIKTEYRSKTLQCLINQLNNFNGSGALAWLNGSIELAEELELITTSEANQFINEGKRKHEAAQAAKKAAAEALAAERKAKAKAAKEEAKK